MINGRIIPNTVETDLITHTIKINGAAISRTFGVLSILVMRELNKIPTARIELIDGSPRNQDFPVSDDALFVPGNEIEILLGYHAEESSIFKGIITQQKIKVRRQGAELRIECKDVAVKMTVGSKSRYFLEQTDSDAIEAIAGDYGLDTNIESTDVTHAELIQFESTDWDFILSRAEANSKVCLLMDGELQLLTPTIGEQALEVTYGSSSLEEFDAEMDARWQYTGVTAKSWDYAGQEIIEAESADPALEEAGNLSANDLAGVIDLDTFQLFHVGQVKQDELQAWADAQLLKSRLSKIRGRVKFQGYAGINPGDTLLLSGLGDRMNGKVYVSGIRHEMTAGNWYTDAQFGLPPDFFTRSLTELNASKASGLLPAINGLQIGIVTQLEGDPDGEDRIRVKLPIVNPEEDGAWARIAALDAGDNRGAFFRPEIGDEVIVGFLNDDPRDPVVLGMLNSSAKPAPLTASDDNHEKGFVTRSEMKCLFNDDVKSITLETPGGDKILLSEDEGGITITDENGNKIVLNSDGITIESAKDLILKAAGDVKLEGVNVNQKAQAQFKAEGTAGLEVSSSAIAVLKGSLVQIN